MSSSQNPTDLSYGSGGHTGYSGNSTTSAASALSPISILTPTSASTLYASPDSATQTFFGAKSEPDDGDASSGSSVTAAPSFAEPAKKKQKRNKPTLSCYECVERKTKASACMQIPNMIYSRLRNIYTIFWHRAQRLAAVRLVNLKQFASVSRSTTGTMHAQHILIQPCLGGERGARWWLTKLFCVVYPLRIKPKSSKTPWVVKPPTSIALN